jgi:uncharacterized membrane protein
VTDTPPQQADAPAAGPDPTTPDAPEPESEDRELEGTKAPRSRPAARAGAERKPRIDRRARHRRANRLMVLVLIPLAVWTIAGLIALWPSDTESHVNREGTNYGVTGVSYPSGRVTNIARISCEGVPGSTSGTNTQVCANLTVQVTSGEDQGQTVVVPVTHVIYASGISIGQRVTLLRIPPIEGQPSQFQFADFNRGAPLLVFTLIFAAAVLLVARWRGLAALVALGVAGIVLTLFVFPALVSGTNPVLIGLIASVAIAFVAVFAAQGLSMTGTIALVGAVGGLIVTAILGWIATRWAHLTGVSGDGDYVLASAAPDLLLSSVISCGIILAALGVLIAVCTAQARAVWRLSETELSARRLFTRAMRSGREFATANIAAIAFATVGAVLPVLLLVVVYGRPLLEVFQTEQFAATLLRILVASTGIVLAIPLTTAVGVLMVRLTRGPLRARKARPTRPGRDVDPDGPQRRRRRRSEFDDLDFSDLREPQR